MHPVIWTSPTPLWGRFGTSIGGASFRAADQRRPAILRFASDEFMEQLLALLDANPRELDSVIARPETWRSPLGETPNLIQRTPMPRLAQSLLRSRRSRVAVEPVRATKDVDDLPDRAGTATVPLKLYHPAHQRHYLVAANLVCGIPGFPDRAVASGGREQIGFVLRRLLVPNGSAAAEEFAFVKDASGVPSWQRLAVPNDEAGDGYARLADGEELLPLFPMNFHDDTGHPRRMFAGIIPVVRREEYLSTFANKTAATSTTVSSAAAAGSTTDPKTIISERKEQFRAEVSEPWKNLIRAAYAARARITDQSLGSAKDADGPFNAVRVTNRQLQAQSWLVLLDFADYLATHVPRVFNAASDAGLTLGEKRLFEWLESDPRRPWLITGGTPKWPSTGTPGYEPTLREALEHAKASRTALENSSRTFPDEPDRGQWPNKLCLLVGIDTSLQVNGVHATLATQSPDVSSNDVEDDTDPTEPLPPTFLTNVESAAALLDKLVQLVIGAIDTSAPAYPAPPRPFAAQLRAALGSTAGDGEWFVLRCAYVRRNCGPLQPAVMSAPSQRFQLASFFDPDAPARPIRIALPIDTTAAGMRKFNKNTAFMISDVLCGQIQRAKGLGLGDLVMSVLPWPLHKDLDVGDMGPCKSGSTSIGMICSLSIPIITICALILLMIIVSLLDFIFRWIPWFIICFPIPGFKAKRS